MKLVLWVILTRVWQKVLTGFSFLYLLNMFLDMAQDDSRLRLLLSNIGLCWSLLALWIVFVLPQRCRVTFFVAHLGQLVLQLLIFLVA